MAVGELWSRRSLRAAVAAGIVCAGLLTMLTIWPPAGRATSSGCTTPGSGVVADFCFQPTDTAAGSDAGLDTTITFNYPPGDTTDTVKNLTVTLAPGLVAIPAAPGETCTQTELTSGTCPAASQVGTGLVTAGYPGIKLVGIPAYSALYEMAVPPADTDTDVAYLGLGIWLGASAPAAGTAPAQTANASGSITTVGGQPAVAFTFDGLPSSLPLDKGKLAVPIQVQSLSLDIDGTVIDATGAPTAYTRLPTNCAAAVTTLTVDTVSASTDGGGSDSFTPTGCASLPFSPSLTVSATKDSGDLGVSFSSTISQPAGEAADSYIELAVPAATLAPNLAAAISEFGVVVGSAQAVTPLLSAPLVGTVTLTGTVAAPFLTISFPPPVPLTLTGAVDIEGNTVTFTGLPDVPLSSLTVMLNGGAGALYATVCSNPYGVVNGTFGAQNGGSAGDDAPFTISNCALTTAAATTSPAVTTITTTPVTPVTAPPIDTARTNRPPTLSHASLSGLARADAVLRFWLTAGSSQLDAFTVSLPRGLSFDRGRLQRGVTLSGGRIRSLRLSHGALIVDLRSASSTVRVTLSAAALDEQPALRGEARSRRQTTLSGTIAVTTSDGAVSHLKLRVRT